ncbi:MAG TPA: polyprenol monophosphomannose synthase [Candidatus Nanoarchaeia archaeon]|nr:polyprenol monophosphomannose synthase [Candidatus Nanoarchaeia archaeon]
MRNKHFPKVSVVLPTYNENENIVKLIRSLLKYLGSNVELIVSDDNSPDMTWKIAQDLKLPQVKVIRRFKNKGLGPAIWDGIKVAKGRYIVWMDCDLTMPPSLVPRMIKLLKDYDVVVGSRYAKGGADKRSLVRVVTSYAINLLANLILNFKVRDYDSGFVAVRRDVFKNIDFEPKGHGEYCIEFLYKCTKRGYRIKEIGFVFTERKKGESKTAQYIYSVFWHGFKYVGRILKVRLGNL